MKVAGIQHFSKIKYFFLLQWSRLAHLSQAYYKEEAQGIRTPVVTNANTSELLA